MCREPSVAAAHDKAQQNAASRRNQELSPGLVLFARLVLRVLTRFSDETMSSR